MQNQYAYLDKADFDLKSAFNTLEQQTLKTTDAAQFRDLAQSFVKLFHDPHLNVGPYDDQDFSVIPSGSDIWAVATSKGSYEVRDVKGSSAAARSGVRVGDEIMGIDGQSTDQAASAVLGSTAPLKLGKNQREYAVNVALAGRRNQPRSLVLKRGSDQITIQLPSGYDSSDQSRGTTPLSSRAISTRVGYIRFNNSLGDAKSVPAFQTALQSLSASSILILDLRDTPSGGNTDVANPILGHFAVEAKVYQKYRVQTPDQPYSKVELQSAYTDPTKPYFSGKVIVLVGRWTGSMGEGMAIGLDSFGAAIVGSPMGHLLGGIKKIDLNHSQSWIELGFERMYHVKGQFREDFIPSVAVEPSDFDSKGHDPALAKAVEIARGYKK